MDIKVITKDLEGALAGDVELTFKVGAEMVYRQKTDAKGELSFALDDRYAGDDLEIRPQGGPFHGKKYVHKIENKMLPLILYPAQNKAIEVAFTTQQIRPQVPMIFEYVKDEDGNERRFELVMEKGEIVRERPPYAVQFTAQCAGNIDAYEWGFGDGGASEEKNPLHFFERPGIYDVTLTVHTEEGQALSSQRVRIQPLMLFADFDSDRKIAMAGQVVQFINRSQGNIERFEWDFGDGLVSTTEDPIHVFHKPGTYGVKLNVRGPVGEYAKMIENYLTIEPYEGDAEPASEQPQEANFSWEMVGVPFTFEYQDSPQAKTSEHYAVLNNASLTRDKPPLVVQFINGAKDPSATYHWEFGDGRRSDLPDPMHHYDAPGIYSVKFNVKIGDQDLEKIRKVTVYEPTLLADFDTDRSKAQPGKPVQFANHSTGHAHTYRWDFGDGSFSDQAYPTHTYDEPGEYTVTLTVSGTNGDYAKTIEQCVDVVKVNPITNMFDRFTSKIAPLMSAGVHLKYSLLALLLALTPVLFNLGNMPANLFYIFFVTMSVFLLNLGVLKIGEQRQKRTPVLLSMSQRDYYSGDPKTLMEHLLEGKAQIKPAAMPLFQFKKWIKAGSSSLTAVYECQNQSCQAQGLGRTTMQIDQKELDLAVQGEEPLDKTLTCPDCGMTRKVGMGVKQKLTETIEQMVKQ